jgi:hypothetical protein
VKWPWSKREAPAPVIPPYHPPITQEHAPKEEGLVVEENLDPSDSMILRVKDAIVRKLKGE